MALQNQRVVFLTYAGLIGRGGGEQAGRAFAQAGAALWRDRFSIISADKLAPPLPCPIAAHISVPSRSRFQKLRYLLALRCTDRLTPFVDRTFATLTEGASLLVLNGSQTGRFAKLASQHAIASAVIHLNVDRDFYRDNVRAFFPRMLYMFIAHRNQRIAWRWADLNLTLTEHDGRQLSKMYGSPNRTSRVLGVSECWDDGQLPEIQPTSVAKRSLCIATIGSLDYPQSARSIIWFVERIAPVLVRRGWSFELVAAGKNPTSELLSCAARGLLRIVANPPRMDDVLRDADLLLCPTNTGSGIKTRLMDGFRNGLPIVAHEVSARGYEKINGVMLEQYVDMDGCLHALERLRISLPLPLGRRRAIQQSYRDQFAFALGVERFRNAIASLESV